MLLSNSNYLKFKENLQLFHFRGCKLLTECINIGNYQIMSFISTQNIAQLYTRKCTDIVGGERSLRAMFHNTVGGRMAFTFRDKNCQALKDETKQNMDMASDTIVRLMHETIELDMALGRVVPKDGDKAEFDENRASATLNEIYELFNPESDEGIYYRGIIQEVKRTLIPEVS